MKYHSIFLLIIIALLSSNCAIRSGLGIEPNKEFVLGGNENHGFKASVYNDGETSVTLHELLKDGQMKDLGILLPGESVKAKFQNSSAAIFKNKNEDAASLKVKVTGDVNLGMTYNGL